MSRLPAAFFWTGMAMALLSKGSSSQSPVATIVDSGSTNRAGFQIEVRRSGMAEMTAILRRSDLAAEPSKPIQRKLSSGAVQRFFADLKAADPVAALPAVHCMKSASFGSSLTVKVGNKQTPDLSCGDGGNPLFRNLIRDVHEIVSIFQNP
jgi:hypothetical protein